MRELKLPLAIDKGLWRGGKKKLSPCKLTSSKLPSANRKGGPRAGGLKPKETCYTTHNSASPPHTLICPTSFDPESSTPNKHTHFTLAAPSLHQTDGQVPIQSHCPNNFSPLPETPKQECCRRADRLDILDCTRSDMKFCVS